MSDQRSIAAYLDQLASDAPAPGGGSVAGLVAALAAALGSMVVALTRKPAERETVEQLSDAARSLISVRERAVALGARDEAAYRAYIDATRLPKSSPAEKEARRTAVQAALHTTAQVPLDLAGLGVDLLTALVPLARHGNAHLLSDARIAVLLADVAQRAALVTLRVNLDLLRDQAFAEQLEGEARSFEGHAGALTSQLEKILSARTQEAQ